jgi:hypothetical protein
VAGSNLPTTTWAATIAAAVATHFTLTYMSQMGGWSVLDYGSITRRARIGTCGLVMPLI